MVGLPKMLVASVFAPALLLNAGCATSQDIESLRSEVNALRTDQSQISAMAADAAASAKASVAAAERAAAEAKAANEKADQIYRQSLRK